MGARGSHGFFQLLTMILENIKTGDTISPEHFESLHKEILATHQVIQTPKRGIITVRIRRLYNEKGDHVHGQEIFFYVHCYEQVELKKIG